MNLPISAILKHMFMYENEIRVGMKKHGRCCDA